MGLLPPNLGAYGTSSSELWGRDGEDYTVTIKDSAGTSIFQYDDILLPISPGFTTKIKTADESLTSTTLADDTHLKNWVLTANTYYTIDGYLVAAAAGATQDLKIDFVVDNAVQSSNYTYVAVDATTAGTVDAGENQAITAATTIDIDGTANVAIIIKGWIFTNASSNTNLDLQVAQGTDSGTTTLKAGSWLRFEPASS